ncbi:protein bark beetle isoform X1 [Harmonia axyridis]|uniref:protein bark beetle isoform X1 n=1 Tax=Harmonia axyridis TaxID=115357 RepID=UPI001E278F69|nr:protein bark beetle isoform X1 [Harmonia axyridis]
MWQLTLIVVCVGVLFFLVAGQSLDNVENYATDAGGRLTEDRGGVISEGVVVLNRTFSPYWLTNDIIVARGAKLIIEPGVVIKVQPQVGITVRGILIAKGTEDERIILTTAEEKSNKVIQFPDIRLVDGPTILAGRLQLKHKGEWRSVCTNSKNWTLADIETACRQLGFQGGSFFMWYNRLMPLKSRLLYEQPSCSGRGSSLFDCKWSTRQMGAGVCDYHPDLAIQCSPRHDRPLPFWRGLKFEHAEHDRFLSRSRTLYVPKSLSELNYVNIMYAGAGRDQNTTSAVEAVGVVPNMDNVEILNSAYNGINITYSEAPVYLRNCTVRNNRGYGVFINSSYGSAHIDNSVINENGGDGVRFIRALERPEDRVNKYGYNDFCNLAVQTSQIYPVQLFFEQTFYPSFDRTCDKVFTTKYGEVLTLYIVRAVTSKNDSSYIEVYDGTNLNRRLIAGFPIRNNTRPQTITTTVNQMYIKFRAESLTQTVVFLRLVAGDRKIFDLNVSNSEVSDNLGRGIVVDNLRSQLHVHKSSVSKNQYVAGVHVTSGVGDINVTDSKIFFNNGDGINVTYTGGSRNISRTSISSNQGYGVAIWLNHTTETEYVFTNQSTVLQYSEIYKNIDVGVLHGNFCGHSHFNFSGNVFRSSLSDALEIQSCWKYTEDPTQLQIGHNVFQGNERISLKISPALNLKARVEYNHFRSGTFGSILLKNKPLEQFNILPNDILVQQNYFLNNTGIFVVNFALSPYATNQNLMFTRNFVKNNKITEPFQPEDGSISNLVPRSRVAAPVVVGSNNVIIFRNIIENPDSKYEIGSHLEDQSKTINCTYNWFGYGSDENIFHRIFHRFDRYNLAKIVFIPFLLHNSNPLTNKYGIQQTYVPTFSARDSNRIGGEIEGEEFLTRGEYVVEKDINIRPGGKLTIEPGVTLRFPSSIGMLVGGQLEARGVGPDSIKLTLKEEISHSHDNETFNPDMEYATEFSPLEPKGSIRLLGGNTDTTGRLQVKINNEWGTVCNYGWTRENAALVCQQLGFVLNPDDWIVERNELPDAGITEKILLSNVQCDDFDMDITKCRAERPNSFENSCTHENDVGVKCYKTSWAGVRFAGLAERSNIQYLTIEQSGLLDYATNSFKPALQLDFARHNFENIKITNNFQDGLGILYSDIFTDDTINIIKNSEFSNNKGAGISIKQFGLNVYGSVIEGNKIGVKHDSSLPGLQQREFTGWFVDQEENYVYRPISIPYYTGSRNIELQHGETKYLVTQRVEGNVIMDNYMIRCDPGWVIGIQLLNPIENRSTEEIFIKDALTSNGKSDRWSLKRDLTVFPTTSSSYGIILEYSSGTHAVGGTVIVLSNIRAPVQNIVNKIVKGPVPTLTIHRSVIRNNEIGIMGLYYNRYLDELGNHYLRKANETLKCIFCDISHNKREAILIESPNWDLHKSNISETVIMINNSLITDNGQGIYHFSRDMRQSNNLFHYVLQHDTIERNKYGGFDIRLPYVWQYNENFTHSVFMDNNTWTNNKDLIINIDGHYAEVNITRTKFNNNYCKSGLLSIKGMEKKLLIVENKFNANNAKFLMKFNLDSQSEIVGDVPAIFMYNELRDNRFVPMKMDDLKASNQDATTVISFKGIQKVRVRRNLMSNNDLDFLLIAGIKTAKINNTINVAENWWGTGNLQQIQEKIFDFHDWNNHAIAEFQPYLLSNDFEASFSTSYDVERQLDLDNLGGQIFGNLTLSNSGRPYVIKSDITVMPGAILRIDPGVVMEFPPNVGILVLGSLKARGFPGNEIIMRPIGRSAQYKYITRKRRGMEKYQTHQIRLCKDLRCQNEDNLVPNEGFLEYFNSTTFQWVPMCDPRFTERNAQVVCRELGFDALNAYFDHDIRIEFHSNSLTRIWSWPEPLQCEGTESRYTDCPIRLNGQQYGHRHSCKWNSKFVFINCGDKMGDNRGSYWGGVRFADPLFEQQLFIHRLHDVHTHSEIKEEQSSMEFVNIIGAGILHNEKSPAIQGILKSPKISYVTIKDTASHGLNFISPQKTLNLLHNTIKNSAGVAINILSLTGEGRESEHSSFAPLRDLNIPYQLFGLVDICDPHKEIIIEEKMLLYYKYDNHPVNCIKIFKSAFNIKGIGFRLLQFNLFNSTNKYTVPDFISLYDGDIFNVTSKKIAQFTMTSQNENRFFKTGLPSLSVKLFANGASSNHGFFAEVVTLPISAISFNRDVQHNISFSTMENNREGGLLYMSAGEVNPVVTVEKNQFKNNCKKFYGNFTTCNAAVEMDVQNTESIFFRNNLVEGNQGGLTIRSDSSSSATSLKGYIQNNLFVNNTNLPALYIEGRQSSPYQEVVLKRNYFTRNVSPYVNNIILKQVVSSFTHNYVKRNIGLRNIEISGFARVRLPIFQTTSHNGFYNNYALAWDTKSTIVAGTAGQQYVDNIFSNPDNDYEMITVNRSLFEFNSSLQLWNTKIDAISNFWGVNNSLAVSARIRDQNDDPRLLEVKHVPYLMNNKSILNDGKCPPGWNLVGQTCFIFIGAPMSFHEAKAFCEADNASMPFILGNIHYLPLYNFIKKQSQWNIYSERVWVQHIDKINECTMFAYQTIDVADCDLKNSFICEIDPQVTIRIIPLTDDIVTLSIVSGAIVALLVLIMVIVCWWMKSKFRQKQRLERRNSIRTSLHSLRSVGLTPSAFSDPGYRRKVGQMSTRSTDTLTKGADYRKVISNGSIDSMEKSAYNSSIEDTHSVETYESQNPNPSAFTYNHVIELHKSPSKFENQYAKPNTFELGYKNNGFRDNSTFASTSNFHSANQSVDEGSINDDETPIMESQNGRGSSYPPSDYYTTDTLPLTGHYDNIDNRNENKQRYDPKYSRDRPNKQFLYELKQRIPQEELPPPPEPPSSYEDKIAALEFSPDYNTVGLASYQADRPPSSNILETDFDTISSPSLPSPPRAKSEMLLETNFDYTPVDSPVMNQPISSRSKSQPLETAM